MIRKILFFMLICYNTNAQPISFPLKASANKKFIVDQNNKPVFLNGTATWRLGYNVSYEDAKKYLADRKERGYNSIIVEITPDLGGDRPEHGNQPNLYGEYTFIDTDISKPNEKFFAHADSILQLCNDMNFAVLLFPLYLGCCEDGWIEILQRKPNTVEKCREYGKWVARRYQSLPNIIWASGGDHDETPESLAFAEGIASVDNVHLQTYHTGPGHTSTERIPDAAWMTLSCTYTYFPAMDQHFRYYHVYAQLYMEEQRNTRMPYIMAESEYENERSETTQFIRRQAYWSLLGGACGHMFGNRDTWMMNKDWPNALHTPGNESMEIFYELIKTIPWYDLKTDWAHLVFTSGRGEFNPTQYPGGDEYATGAITKDGKLALLYMPTYRTVCVNLQKFSEAVSATWFDPSSGKYTTDKKQFSNKGVVYLTPPARNNDRGFDDWVLIIQTKK
ncbi:MAG: DUF4038 domain-containing protein [Bacteroidetes bacterium]|nr:DUF4038 domain-containing protein [Bacteroidota bacterium]